jgi:hypothetical protein
MMKKGVKTVNKNKNGVVVNGVNGVKDVNMTVTEADDDGTDATNKVTNGGSIVKKKKISTCAVM